METPIWLYATGSSCDQATRSRYSVILLSRRLNVELVCSSVGKQFSWYAVKLVRSSIIPMQSSQKFLPNKDLQTQKSPNHPITQSPKSFPLMPTPKPPQFTSLYLIQFPTLYFAHKSFSRRTSGHCLGNFRYFEAYGSL